MSSVVRSISRVDDAPTPAHSQAREFTVAVLTGGGDRAYALGVAECLIAEGLYFDFIGSDELESEDLERSPQVRVLNLRGDMISDASLAWKACRVLVYYARLIKYAATAEPSLFHILWNNKFQLIDRTLLLLYYRLLGKRLVLTVHNVNIGLRDGTDNWLNRWTLKVQYRLTDHLLVHTKLMRDQLVNDFGVPPQKISIIPFGINDATPRSAITREQARARIGVVADAKVILFFGNIAPYKGLEYLVDAFSDVAEALPDCVLVIAGRVKSDEDYWNVIQRKISRLPVADRIVQRIEYIPEEEAELYFKAADVLILPYTYIFQSGVLFLGYSFGLPVIASDVASLREDIVEGSTGVICKPKDSQDLGAKIVQYFRSDLYRDLAARRDAIRAFAEEKYSWAKVGAIVRAVYERYGAIAVDARSA